MALTYKEMHDTFDALAKTTDYMEKNWANIEAYLKSRNRFIFVGCGSSYSNAKSFAMLCNMSTGIPAMALAAGDILLHAERYKKCINGAGVVFISRSGRTSELIKALDKLKEIGCDIDVASFVCADGTPLGEKSDLVLSTPWAFDESVCQTRCVTNAYYMATYIFAKITDNATVLADLQLLLKDGPAYMAKAEELSKELATMPWTHSVILADAELEGIAEEGSLVFKEVCQLPSSYHHSLDVRHGPMVLIGEETLVIVALGTSCELEVNLLKDIVAKGADVVALSDVCAEFDGVRTSCFGAKLSHAAMGIPLIILCQMIAYYKSKETGADPDKPTGLDSWIAL
ncbi:MAG: SIS domain-containing protein [Oscillospiraceae bacterium]|nr:SIS domain-containing protein [Oscillospiraceae bacterium]